MDIAMTDSAPSLSQVPILHTMACGIYVNFGNPPPFLHDPLGNGMSGCGAGERGGGGWEVAWGVAVKSGQVSPSTDGVVGWTRETIQQKSSSILFFFFFLRKAIVSSSSRS